MRTLAFSYYAEARHDLVSIGTLWFSRNSINNLRYTSRMACKLLMQCDLIFGFLKCALTEDTINVDLQVCTLKGIHTFWKDYKLQMTKCSPWDTKVHPYPSLNKKMVEFMRHWQTITTPFTNRPYQQKPKMMAKKHNLVPLTRPNRAQLSPTRRINVGKLPEAIQQNWESTISRSLIQEAKNTA